MAAVYADLLGRGSRARPRGSGPSLRVGSRTAIATIRGLPTPSAHPEAELWFGAHPAGQAQCLDADGRPEEGLLTLIENDPIAALGSPVVDEFGVRLPYLLKVLAAEEPLSLQASGLGAGHRRVRPGERCGNPPRRAGRNYRDPWHKPEVVLAVTPFDALAGFRDPAHGRPVARTRAAGPRPLPGHDRRSARQRRAAGLVHDVDHAARSVLADLVPAVIDAAVGVLAAGGTAFDDELRTARVGRGVSARPWGPRVAAAQTASTWNPEALYLAAGNLHAYLRSTAIEIMANSDNVLRGGLTPKHIDVPELLRVLDFAPVHPADLSPKVSVLGAERIYDSGAGFRLSQVELDGTGLRHRRPSPSTCPVRRYWR